LQWSSSQHEEQGGGTEEEFTDAANRFPIIVIGFAVTLPVSVEQC
jgi:hypothetical protein